MKRIKSVTNWVNLAFVLVIGALMLMIVDVDANGGSVNVGDGVLLDAVAFSNGDTLSVLVQSAEQTGFFNVEFVYLFIGGGSSRETFWTPQFRTVEMVKSKLVVAGRYAHLIVSDNEQTYQFSFKLPDEAPFFNCPTQLLPYVQKGTDMPGR